MRDSLSRAEGHPIGIIANNNHHLGAGRLTPMLRIGAAVYAALRRPRHTACLLCDTPGIMVGPQAEEPRFAMPAECS